MHRPAERIAAIVLAATIAGIGLAARPAAAKAETYEELQQRVEESTAAFDEAMANVERIQGEIDTNKEKIAQIEAEIPQQRARAAESMRTLYKMHQSSNVLIDLILSADNFNDLISTITYLDRIQSRQMVELEELAAMNAELTETKDILAARKAQAKQEADSAREAQEEAVAARDEMVQQAIEQARAEEAAAQAALEEAQRKAEEGTGFTNASGQEVVMDKAADTTSIAETVSETSKQEKSEEQEEEKKDEAPEEDAGGETEAEEESEPDVPVVTSEREAFVNSWASRIDNYLAGSPLGGHGRTFAEAAWDYGVDPRWSPAISCIESSKGAVCFLPHNAWGWGSVSWPDWDTAIRSHVAGLSAGYGYTISLEAAKKYCDDGTDWYGAVLGEMNSI